MKPAPFEYIAPDSLAEALSALQTHGYEGKLLAGGQSLIPVMNFRLAQPAVIIDLNNIAELATLTSRENGSVSAGAMVRQSRLEQSNLIAQKAPLVGEVMPFVAHPQIRNRGTIGGSLAHADPAAELPVVMVALQAEFRLQRQGAERWVPAEDFYQSLFMTAMEPEEMLVEISIPPLPLGAGFAFTEIARRHGDYAQVGVAAIVTLDDEEVVREARIVFLNVGETPMVASQAAEMIIGERATLELMREASTMASEQEIEPVGDIHASTAYKRHLAAVLGERTMLKAVDRARQGGQS